jgi:hypothetical protein
MTNAESQKLRKQRKKARGECYDCFDKARPGRVRCESCLVKRRKWERERYRKYREKKKAYSKERRKQRKKEGLCAQCGGIMHGDWIEEGFTHCWRCCQRLFYIYD